MRMGARRDRKRPRTRKRLSGLRPVILALLPLGLAGVLVAQVPGDWGRFSRAGWAGGYHQREMVPAERRGFYTCWLAFDRTRIVGSKQGWATDYPLAMRNFTLRLGEFTTTTIHQYDDGAPADGVVRLLDEGLFQCPFLFTSDIGSAVFSTEEGERLREYLQKGGFLWADDSWGRAAKDRWLSEFNRMLPGYEHVYLGADHPLMTSFYELKEVPQMPSAQHWLRSGGERYETRGVDSSVPTLSAFKDENGRVAAVFTHNTDIGDGMEREGVDPGYFFLFSPHAYAMGINIALYAMTR
jgi:hypothetical protein